MWSFSSHTTQFQQLSGATDASARTNKSIALKHRTTASQGDIHSAILGNAKAECQKRDTRKHIKEPVTVVYLIWQR